MMHIEAGVNLVDLQELCSVFDVNLSVHPNIEGVYIKYQFGPVAWLAEAHKPISFYDYNRISMRLAATFPDKVLK